MEDVLLGVSMTLNENLAAIFYRLKLIEAYGTGMSKVMRSYEGCPVKPKFEASDNAFKITLPNRNVDMGQPALNEQEQAITSLAERKKQIVRRDAEEALGVSQTMAGRVLRQLVQKGILKTMGGGKNTRYGLRG